MPATATVKGCGFGECGQSATAAFHLHQHYVDTGDGDQTKTGYIESGDGSDADDGSYSSISGILAQTGTATNDGKDIDQRHESFS